MNIKTDKWFVYPLIPEEIFKTIILLEAAGFESSLTRQIHHNTIQWVGRERFATTQLTDNQTSTKEWKLISLKELQEEAIKIIGEICHR